MILRSNNNTNTSTAVSVAIDMVGHVAPSYSTRLALRSTSV